MVRKAFEAETVGAVDALMIEIREVKKSGKGLTAKRYAQMFGQYQELHSKTKEYGNLLDQKLSETHSRLELLELAIVQLGDKVKR
jgi:hypothetical protein